jgi:transposase
MHRAVGAVGQGLAKEIVVVGKTDDLLLYVERWDYLMNFPRNGGHPDNGVNYTWEVHMTRKRRTYTREFKVEAVKLVTEKGYSVAEAARSLGIGETLLRSWKQALENHGEQAFPGHGNLPALEEELRQLKAENRRLQMERDILKKATAFFAKEAL